MRREMGSLASGAAGGAEPGIEGSIGRFELELELDEESGGGPDWPDLELELELELDEP